MPGFSISAVPIDCAGLSAAVKADAAGGFVSFEGWVRNSNEGLDVDALEYEVFHDLAISEGQKILQEAIRRFELIDAAAVHREGFLPIGECAVWIGVAARHRGEAFAGCRYIIDEMKHRLPVWKKEHYRDCEPQWVNCRHQHHHAPQPALSEAEFYARQIVLPGIGPDGQKALRKARVLIVGIGGLGSAAGLALAGAGIGRIGLVDHDALSASNLHRQLIYAAADIGKPKVHLAAARLLALNPFIEIDAHAEKATAENIASLLSAYDIVLDCTDNFPSKYLLNDAAVGQGKILVQASLYQFEGQLLTVDPGNDAGCLRCLFPEPPMPGMVGDCATAGVLGTVPAVFGHLQANEAIKAILGLGVARELITYDLLSLQSQKLQRVRQPDCTVCGYEPRRARPQTDTEFAITADDTDEDLRRRFVLIDVRETAEREAVPFDGSLHYPSSTFDPLGFDLPKDQPLLVVCARGARSRLAADALREAGWTETFSLSGGIGTWPKKARSSAAEEQAYRAC